MSVADVEIELLPAVAVIFTFIAFGARPATDLKATPNWPNGDVTEAGTLKVVWSVESVTVKGPDAERLNARKQLEVVLGATVVGVQFNPVS
jgi:hypothetical protein